MCYFILFLGCRGDNNIIAQDRLAFKKINHEYERFYKALGPKEKTKHLDIILKLTESQKSKHLDFEYEKSLALARKWIILDEIGARESLPQIEKDAAESLAKVVVLKQDYDFQKLLKLVKMLDSSD